MAGSPLKRARRESARAAVIATLPPGAEREELEARQFVDGVTRYDGDAVRALRAMGVDTSELATPALFQAALSQVNRERVRELLEQGFSDLERYKPALLARQVDIALTGDDESSTRAFMTISKVAGWVAPTKVDVRNQTLNLHALLNNPEAIEAALAATSHEPGAAVAVDDEGTRETYMKRVVAISSRDDDDDAEDDDA